MITCSKSYRDIPLSHRQPLHSGRCSRLHGHSWAITLTFEAQELDENGFIIDFGDLHFIKDWIDLNLDHATALKKSDPMREECEKLEEMGLLKILWLDSASCEGIAQFLYHIFQPMIEEKTQDRVRLQSLLLEEDSKNSATFTPPA
jgi:6-pyruvoyltetrahydropterin/6-carboxytetrahydropterin synthase